MWATPLLFRCTRKLCFRPCTLSVPRITANAAFARDSRVAGPDCAEATAASAKLSAIAKLDFFIAISLSCVVCPGQFLGEARRAYTTPRQDARACCAKYVAAEPLRSGEYIDAL